MSLIKMIKRLDYDNFLINKGTTGDLKISAHKMKLSPRAIKDLLFQMRELGALVKYGRARRTYYYLEEGEICVSKFMKYGQVLTKDDITKIGEPEDLCFSEKAVFVLCEDI